MIKTLRLLNGQEVMAIIESAEKGEVVTDLDWLNLMYTMIVDVAIAQLVGDRVEKLKAQGQS